MKDLGRGRGYQLVKLGYEPLSSEAIVDGAVMDSQVVIETIQRFSPDRLGHGIHSIEDMKAWKSAVFELQLRY